MGAVKELEIFLLYFDREFEWTEQVYLDKTGGLEEITVVVAKMGGGTPGKEYQGRWLYTLVGEGSADPKVWGDDLETGMPHTHQYVARLVAMMYAEGSLDPGYQPC